MLNAMSMRSQQAGPGIALAPDGVAQPRLPYDQRDGVQVSGGQFVPGDRPAGGADGNAAG